MPTVRYDGPVMDLLIVLVVILAVVLVWRGPKMLPKWGETLGRGVRATRREISELQDETKGKDDAAPPAG